MFTLRSSRPGRERRATEEVALRERDTVVSRRRRKVMSDRVREGVDDALRRHAQLVMEPRGHQVGGRGHADRRRKAVEARRRLRAKRATSDARLARSVSPGVWTADRGRERFIGHGVARELRMRFDGQATQRVLARILRRGHSASRQ